MGTPLESSSPPHSNFLAIFTMCYAALIVGARNLITANSALNRTLMPAFALRRRLNRLPQGTALRASGLEVSALRPSCVQHLHLLSGEPPTSPLAPCALVTVPPWPRPPR